ncbi:hypothetical protein GMRT_12418 [Giardia muris]|uniref:Uncharacterized protein n=1 Tax=Giardia muris TaxID=5742 RepID=A0A4Z1SQL9_GIAMU|nr:hypothetical protein GMRT_12418 [Giardia muris]|eukprot:TNJ27225.1 hypothetical protein GMRT_12418 [Giardia muris]
MFVPTPIRMRPCTRLDASAFRREGEARTGHLSVGRVYRQYFVENGIPVEVRRARVWATFFARRRSSTPPRLIVEANKAYHVVGAGRLTRPPCPLPEEEQVKKQGQKKEEKESRKAKRGGATALMASRPDLEVRRLPKSEITTRRPERRSERSAKRTTTPERRGRRRFSDANDWPGSTGLRNVHFLSSTDIETISSTSLSNDGTPPVLDVSPRLPAPFQRPNLLRKYMLGEGRKSPLRARSQ